MPKSLTVILNYIRDSIQRLQDTLKDLNILISDLEEYDRLIDTKDEKILKLNSFFDEFKIVQGEYVESFNIVQRFGDSSFQDEIQIVKSKEFLDDIKYRVKKLLQEKKVEYEDKIDKYMHFRKQYFSYLNFFDDAKLRDDISWNEISSFIKFLYGTDISRDIVEDFERYCYANYKSLIEDDKVLNIDVNMNTLNEELTREILSCIKDYDNLSYEEKNVIFCARDLITNGNDFDLKDLLGSQMNSKEILYFLEVLNLKEMYNNYLNKMNISHSEINDALKEEQQGILAEIYAFLNRIFAYKSIISKLDEEINELLQSNNLLVFLNTSDYNTKEDLNKKSILEFDIDNIRSHYEGDNKKVIAKILHIINEQLRLMNIDELHNLESSRNKLLSNSDNKYECFDEFDVYLRKGIINNYSYITYLTIPVSENNQKVLQEKYGLGQRPFVHLILGLFAQNDIDNQYIDITHMRLQKERFNILRMVEVFKSDFTDETRKEAYALIEESKKKLDIIFHDYLKKGVM